MSDKKQFLIIDANGKIMLQQAIQNLDHQNLASVCIQYCSDDCILFETSFI